MVIFHPIYASGVTSEKQTQDEPVMDGAMDATEAEKEQGRRDKRDADDKPG